MLVGVVSVPQPTTSAADPTPTRSMNSRRFMTAMVGQIFSPTGSLRASSDATIATMRTSTWAVVAFVLGCCVVSSAEAQISLTGPAYTQSFDTLASTGTSATLPAGWALLETGTGADMNYTAGTGSSAAADTYSFGSATAVTDRALGSIRTNALGEVYGAQFTNGTGSPIGSLMVSYHGEQWRMGSAGVIDRLDFQYSLDATSVGTGTWTDVDTLDFTGPDTVGTGGSRDGNDATHQVSISGTVTFAAAIASGATFWLRWSDLNAPGTDHALAIDDVSVTPAGATTGSVVFDVFFDADGNGTHDVGETGIGGWGIALDGGTSRNTAADGSATFSGVMGAVSHAVTNTPPTAAGTWNATAFPTIVTTSVGGTMTYHVAITCTCPDDGDLCTNIPTCNAGACPVPTPINCNDTNLCTDDSCSAGICMHTNNTAICNDGSPLTRNDVCGGGSCAGTVYTCTPGTCEFMSVPNGTDCDVTFLDSMVLCGASGTCDHCSGSSNVCVATTCPVDAGLDAGGDADLRIDAGTDAGSDAGSDAGMDAAVDVDSGIDAAAGGDSGIDAASTTDAGVHDAGAHDGGPDSGRDGSAGDGSVRVDSGATPPPPSTSCGCATAGRGAPSALWLGLIGLVLFARKRTRSQR